MGKVIEYLKSVNSEDQYASSLQLIKMLLDNKTVKIVAKALPTLEDKTFDDVTKLLGSNHNFDPHLLLPYMKEPLPLDARRNIIVAHRRDFTATNLLKAVTKIPPDLWGVTFELIHEHMDETVFPKVSALTKNKNSALKKYAIDTIAKFDSPGRHRNPSRLAE